MESKDKIEKEDKEGCLVSSDEVLAELKRKRKIVKDLQDSINNALYDTRKENPDSMIVISKVHSDENGIVLIGVFDIEAVEERLSLLKNNREGCR